MSELKPCPFCGGEARVNTLEWVGGYTATALCKNEPNFHYIKAWDEDEKKAVERITEAWNMRAGEGTRWHELFGTPARAARTLAKHCDEYHCVVCTAYHHGCGEGDYDMLLEWLGGDA